MGARAKSLKAGENAPNIVNVININGTPYSIGDLRKTDFASLEDPKCSAKSLQAWAIQLNNILRGFSQMQEG